MLHFKVPFVFEISSNHLIANFYDHSFHIFQLYTVIMLGINKLLIFYMSMDEIII